MKKILIADANKASLLMTSEIFKEHYPGIKICIAQTSKEALNIAESQKKIDAFIIDFELPDLNGALTAQKIKKISSKPILITAFESPEFLEGVTSKSPHQFRECHNFLKKPLNSDLVRAVCTLYSHDEKKTQQPVTTNLFALIRKFQKVRNEKKSAVTNNTIVPILIEEYSLNAIKFHFFDRHLHPESQKNLLQEMPLTVGDRMSINFQDPQAIELGQNLEIEKIFETKTKSLLNVLPFELIGTVTDINISENKFWITFENIFLSKKIFEALLNKKMNENPKKQYKIWY